jgi:hypothetical protein
MDGGDLVRLGRFAGRLVIPSGRHPRGHAGLSQHSTEPTAHHYTLCNTQVEISCRLEDILLHFSGHPVGSSF